MEKILKYPKLILLVTTIVTLFFVFQLRNVELDNNNMKFIPEDDDQRVISAWIDETFGSSLFILIGLQRPYSTIFDADFLRQIKEFSEEIEQIDTVDKVNSIVTSDYINGDSESIIVENLIPDDFTGTNEEIAALKQKLLSWDMYNRSLFNDDFTATQIYVPLNINAENAGDPEAIASFLTIRDKAQEKFKDTASVYVSGMPVVSGTINEAMSADLKYLIPFVIVVIILIVYIPLRRFGLVFLSLLAVLLASIWAIGAMPIFNVKLSLISTVLPVVLLAVGNSYGLHVIIHYIEERPPSENITKEEHSAYVIELMRVVHKPIFLAAITTLASFLSLCLTKVTPIRDFGIFSSVGVLVSYVLAIYLTPSLLILQGPNLLKRIHKKHTASKSSSFNDKLSMAFASVSQKKQIVLFITFIAVVISIFGARKLVSDNVFIEYFKKTTDIVKSDNFISKEFGGSKIISIVVEADTPEILLHPDTLTVVDGLNAYLTEKLPVVGKVMGFTDLIKRTNQVFNIEESAAGIQIINSENMSPNTETSDFGFGFSDDEEPDFGFSQTYTDSTETKKAVVSAPSKELTTENFLQMLDTASSSKKNMNAGELVTEIKKLTNYQGASYYEIPSDPARYGKKNKEELQRLISNYLILLSSNSNDYSNDPLEPTAIKSTVQLRALGQIDTNSAVKAINQFVKDRFPANVKVTVGGSSLVEGSVNRLVIQSVWSSMIIAFISLFFIVAYFNRSFIAGLIGVLPLTILVLLNFAVMGFMGIKLNIATAMIASLTMGIGIDYTVHFLEAYKREALLSGGTGFIFKAYRTSGIAVITDAVSTCMGFAVLLFSQFVMLADFGLLIALSLFMSAFVGLILVPVILNWLRPKFIFKS